MRVVTEQELVDAEEHGRQLERERIKQWLLNPDNREISATSYSTTLTLHRVTVETLIDFLDDKLEVER